MQEFESQPKCANIPLAGYMLDVVHRITRYKLLFAGVGTDGAVCGVYVWGLMVLCVVWCVWVGTDGAVCGVVCMGGD